jgi:hypothetical protein
MRAAIAALKPVRDLRPQALPIRALAMSGTAIAAGLPCGMWREHTKKFSPQWFLAVHAAIPFVAMLRKAVLMPKWAILLTLIGSSESPWLAAVAVAAACWKGASWLGGSSAGWVEIDAPAMCRVIGRYALHGCHAAIPPFSSLPPMPPLTHHAPSPAPPSAVAGQSVGARMERQRMQQLAARRQPALTASPAASKGSSRVAAGAAPRNDCVMPGLEAGCRQCLKAAESAISWTLAPVVVQ